MHETKARLYVPTAVEEKIVRNVKDHVAKEHGGFTIVEARGGWVNEREELVEETVQVIEVAGMSQPQAEAVAKWIQEKSDETEVMWEITESTFGFKG